MSHSSHTAMSQSGQNELKMLGEPTLAVCHSKLIQGQKHWVLHYWFLMTRISGRDSAENLTLDQI